MSRCFYINLPIGGLAAGVILLAFKTPPAVKQVVATRREKLLQMDFAGTALVMGASLTLLLALQYGGVTYPWNSGVVIGLFVGSGLMVLALVALEMWLGERAMLTPRLICQRTVWVNSVWGFFFAGSYFVTLYFLPIYFQSIDNRSPIGSGVRQIPLIVLFSVSTLASGRAITKTGVAAPYLVAGSVIATISAGLLFTLDIGTSTGKWVGYQILAGFGYGIAFQVSITIVQAHAAPSDMASVTSIILCELFFPTPEETVVPSVCLCPEADCVVCSCSLHRRHVLDYGCAVWLHQPDLAKACQHCSEHRTLLGHGHGRHIFAPGIFRIRAGRCHTCVRVGHQDGFCD
jgi:hypothetical protein